MDVIYVDVYMPPSYRKTESGKNMAQDVLDDLVVTAKKFVSGSQQRVCWCLAMDGNGQFGRNIPGRTGTYCLRTESNPQGKKILGMMDTLNLFAVSTGNNNASAARKRGGASTYSIQERLGQGASYRKEMRCQIDYLMMSGEFRSWFLGCYGVWRPNVERTRQKNDHKALIFRLRVRVSKKKDHSKARSGRLVRKNEGRWPRMDEEYLTEYGRLQRSGYDKWCAYGTPAKVRPGELDLERVVYGEKMAAVRAERESAGTAQPSPEPQGAGDKTEED